MDQLIYFLYVVLLILNVNVAGTVLLFGLGSFQGRQMGGNDIVPTG